MQQSTSEVPVAEPPSRGARSILKAAERLFCERGYDGVSVQDIAAAAGGSRANIFHHFGSKEGLYLAVMQETCRRATPLQDNLLDRRQAFPRRLQRFAHAHLLFLFEHAGAARLVLRELLKGDDRRGKELVDRHVLGENLQRWIALLKDAQRRGEIGGSIDPAVVAVMLLGANVLLFQTRELLRHLPGIAFADDPRYFAEQTARIFSLGLHSGRRRRRVAKGKPARARKGQ
ncbi:MAG: TetR/AcrR family transcriptional regulator [Chromatiales bacterium]